MYKKSRRKDCKYNRSMCNTVIQVAEDGGYHAAMCLELGISRSTFDNYRKNYPEFARAVEQADLISQSDTERTLSDISKNKKAGDFGAAKFILQTKFKEEYPLEKPDSTNTSITINNLNLTNEEKDLRIQQISEKLKLAGYDVSALLNPTTTIINQESSDDCPE